MAVENERKVLEMDEYISKESAISIFRAKAEMAVCTPAQPYFDRAAKMLELLPAADVAPVRHGRWLDVQETDMYVPDLKLTATKTAETCSVCKARIGFIGAKLYLFDSICPSCGAKMDLEV